MKKKILLIGAPGSGKGTQAKLIVKQFGFAHLATGDILRKAINDGSSFGLDAKRYMDKGDLVPDSVVNSIVADQLLTISSDFGFILDGFPRTMNQALFLNEKGIDFDRVIYLNVPLSSILLRMAGRLVCTKCGASFHKENHPPLAEMVCDLCGDLLVVRNDDNPETVKDRYDSYMKNTFPLINFYKDAGSLIEIDGSDSMNGISTQIEHALQ